MSKYASCRLLLPAILILVFACMSAGPALAADGPDQVADSFWKAVWSGKYESAWQYFSAAKKKEITAAMFAEVMRGSVGDSGFSAAIKNALESEWIAESKTGSAEMKVKEALVKEFVEAIGFQCETISSEGEKATVHILLVGPDFDNLPAGDESKMDKQIKDLQDKLAAGQINEEKVKAEIKKMVAGFAKSKQDKMATVYLAKENGAWLIDNME